MRLIWLQFALTVVHLSPAVAQVPTNRQPLYIYFNKFQDFRETNLDSAVYCLEIIAEDPRAVSSLSSLIHDQFAQSFEFSTQSNKLSPAMSTRAVQAGMLLEKITSRNNPVLNQLVSALVKFSKASEGRFDNNTLSSLCSSFLRTELSPEQLYYAKSARYGLMLYQLMSGRPDLSQCRAQIFDGIVNYLKANQVGGLVVSAPAVDAARRGWFRYMYAAASFMKAAETADPGEKLALLKTGFTFSPDRVDRNSRASYFYEQFFLFGNDGNESFKDEYLTELMRTAVDKTELLAILLQTALIEPEYKQQLKDYFEKNKAGGESFEKYWNEAVSATAIPSPSFSLMTLGNKTISKKSFAGKWLLIDFWGTWCGPCRAEHPDMQKFYDSVVNRNQDKLSLLTVACRDQEDAVRDYLKQRNFSFPVAMADEEIEQKFMVKSYPTKILITPAGKQLVIPYGLDWVDFIRKYCDL